MHDTDRHMLVGLKVLHTIVWAFFVGCILGIPIASAYRRFDVALWLTGLVSVECLVLAWNRGRCPLTDFAARYTDRREANFDIYLPLWLARNNKLVFGTIFVADLAILARQFWF